MPRLLHPEALIQCNFIATRDSPVAINPGWARYQQLTYSPAVRAGQLLFMSGQGALDSATGAVVAESDVAAQAEYIYQNVIKVLAAAGGGPQNLVKTIEYVTPAALGRYREVAKVREISCASPGPRPPGSFARRCCAPRCRSRSNPSPMLD